jgi:hypothetical protein
MLDLLQNKKDRLSRLSRINTVMEIQQSTVLRKILFSSDNNASSEDIEGAGH